MGVEAELAQARRAGEARAWLDAYQQFTALDEVATMGVEDLERLAMAGYLTGHEAEALAACCCSVRAATHGTSSSTSIGVDPARCSRSPCRCRHVLVGGDEALAHA